MIPMTTAQYQTLIEQLGALGICLHRQEVLDSVDGHVFRWQQWHDDEGEIVETVTKDVQANLMFVYLPVQGNVTKTVFDIFIQLFEPF